MGSEVRSCNGNHKIPATSPPRSPPGPRQEPEGYGCGGSGAGGWLIDISSELNRFCDVDNAAPAAAAAARAVAVAATTPVG
eukprot:10323779-Karenia_brevis.AAC.1